MTAIPMPDNLGWLAQVKEAILEPDLPIIDAHHHLWDQPHNPYTLKEFLVDINTQDGTGHNVVATVFAQCGEMYRAEGPEHMKPLGETEFVNGIAAQSASGNYGPTRACAAIFSFAELTLGTEVDEVLEAHVSRAPDRFRGVRYMTAHDDSHPFGKFAGGPPKGLLGDAKFREGVSRLPRYNLSFDAWFLHPQIPELTAMAHALPNVKIVLDHFGSPLGIGIYKGKRAEIYEQWKKNIAELAKCQNVFAKLGGLCMTPIGYGFENNPKPPSSDEIVQQQKDWYHYTIDVFGPSRCMFESNFPVDRFGVSYHVLWNAFKKMTRGYSASERAAMFHDTAANFYRIG